MNKLSHCNGTKCYNTTTFADLKKQAKEGNGTAAFQIAEIYFNTAELEKAEKWATRGAKLGNAGCMHYVGLLTYETNIRWALYWLNEGAQKDHQKCMCELGDMYRKGVTRKNRNDEYELLLSINLHEASKWYKKASEAGSVLAKVRLGDMHLNEKKYAKALTWYRDAEGYGSGKAMSRIGDLYRKGLGVKKDKETARQCYEKAQAAGYEKGKDGTWALDHPVITRIKDSFNLFSYQDDL